MQLEFDIGCSVVCLTNPDELLALVHELPDEVLHAQGQQQDSQGAANLDGTGAGNTLLGSRSYPGVIAALKSLCSSDRYQIERLWCEESASYLTDPRGIGNLLRWEPLERQGRERGDARLFQTLLRT